MSGSMKKQLSFLTMAAMMSQSELQTFGVTRESEVNRKRTPKTDLVPIGTNQYLFDEDGNRTLGDHAFKCIASNERNAIRKFTNWKNKQV